MSDYDTLIRGGTVIDGTMIPRFRADVAIKNGKVAKIGGLKGASADKVIDAEGDIVAPGYIDIHTHYDAQILWDPYCTISGWHGVTSVILGNCGFGYFSVFRDDFIKLHVDWFDDYCEPFVGFLLSACVPC